MIEDSAEAIYRLFFLSFYLVSLIVNTLISSYSTF